MKEKELHFRLSRPGGAYVKGHVHMGDTNHSERFATDFLSKVADVVRAEVLEVLKEKLPQTGFMRSVKVIKILQSTTFHSEKRFANNATMLTTICKSDYS